MLENLLKYDALKPQRDWLKEKRLNVSMGYSEDGTGDRNPEYIIRDTIFIGIPESQK